MENPIQIIEGMKIVLSTGLVWLVVMGYWPMDATKQAATLAFGMALINVVGAYFQNRQTTPLANPKDETGEPLVRQVDMEPTRSARKAGNF